MNQHKSIHRQFYKFVLPAMLTMLLSSFYTIVDGFFIGQATQDIGLAAIGLIWPIAALLIALGAGIGTGGAVLMSAAMGEKDPVKAQKYKGITVSLLILVSIVMTAALVYFAPWLVRFLGAEGAVYDAAMEYIIIIAWGGSMQIMATGLTPLIRNCGKSIHAMVIMCVGLVVNIVLDAYFTMVIPWGLAGAAIATTLAQAITVILSLICLQMDSLGKIHFIDMKWDKNKISSILIIGISPFGLSLMPSFITIFNNWQCLAYGQEVALTAYSVMNYFIACVLMLLTGIGEGIQPLISYYHGAKEEATLQQLKKLAWHFSFIIATVFFVFSLFIGHGLATLFNTSVETALLVQRALPILCSSFWFIGLSKLYSSYFYARKHTLYSNLLVYLDPMIFTPLCLFALPLVFGLNGVWFSLTVAQAIVCVLLVILIKLNHRRNNHE